MATVSCPLCKREAEATTDRAESNLDSLGFRCIRCGVYSLTDDSLALLSRLPCLWIASAEARTRSLRGAVPPFFVDSPEAEALILPNRATLCLPRLCSSVPSIQVRLDHSLINLSFAIGSPGRSYEVNSERDRALFWAHDDQFVRFAMDALAAQALSVDDSNPVRLSAKGWVRAEELRGGVTRLGRRPQAFVAMWFDPVMTAAYDVAIEPAIRGAGYEPVRMDRTEHNNRIDDEIIAQIRASTFLVADFTGQRAGVYYEAGFAHGLGRPVIFCVRTDELSQVHFDTRQYSHVHWGTAEELRVRLSNRILATVGRAS